MTRTVLAVVGLLVTSAVPGAAQVLFGEAPASRSVDSDAGLGVVRSRPVRVRLGRIPGASAREATLGVLPPRGHLLVLNLFPGVVVRARMTRSERAGRALVWAGKIEGQPLGDVVLAIVDGVMSGSAVWPGGAYRIRYDGSTHVVRRARSRPVPGGRLLRGGPGRCRGRRGGAGRERRRRVADRRPRRLHAGGPRRGGRDVGDAVAHQHRGRRDEHRLREQRRHTAAAAGGRPRRSATRSPARPPPT